MVIGPLRLQRWWRWHKSLGARGERAAARHLKRHGYRVLARNLRHRFGELDLVVEDRKTGQIAIVEVKSGASDTPPPERHVNHAKRKKLIVLGKLLLKRYQLGDRSIRFDVVGVVWPEGHQRPTRLTHHEDAFRV